MQRIDWAGLMRAGLGRRELGGLGLTPDAFWRLGPGELRIMLGIGEPVAPVGRTRLAALMAAFPDGEGGEADGGSGGLVGATGGTGDGAGQFGRGDGGL